jgi:hypothetical protein
MGRGFWGRIILFFLKVWDWPGSEVPGIKGLFGQLQIGQNGPKIWCQNATLDEMFVSGLALIAWTKCHKKCGYKICYGQYVTNAGWTDSSSIFLWTIWAVLGWTNSPSTFMFAWDAVLQWILCTWVAKYSGLYMRVEVSLGQGVHGLFIIVPPWRGRRQEQGGMGGTKDYRGI